MLRVTTHIERLLLTQDCVIIPGFGGFVLQAVNASYNAEKSLFVPMSKEIMFNTTLQHNDGLLCESYMQVYHMDYDKSLQMLFQDIEELKSELQSEKKVSLGFIGNFLLGDEGQIVFEPKTTDIMSVYSYGLTSFSIPSLAELEAADRIAEKDIRKVEYRNDDVLYIPVSRRLIRTVAASVAAVSLFLLVSTPVRDVNHAAYKASFVPTEMVGYANLYDEPVVEQEMPETSVPVVDESSAEVQPEAVSVEKVEEAQPEAVKPKQKMFHIVIGSFPDKAQADEFIGKVDRKQCPNADMIERGGKFRVFSNKFDNRTEAESYLEEFRSNSQYKDAWLFISR